MKIFIFILVSLSFSLAQAADDNIEVETTRIKANKEQPKVLYVVPWKEMEKDQNTDQKLVLHDFFGDLYDPLLPANTELTSEATDAAIEATK